MEAGDAQDCPWRWPGQYEDAETGDYYNWWRYYNGEAGSFASADPLGLDAGTRLRGYPLDPSLESDPEGLAARIDSNGFFAASHEYGRGASSSGRVRIPYQGSRTRDFTQANRAAGFSSTPDGYTWHHANYNARTGFGDMQLVRTGPHASTPHSGGVSDFSRSTGIRYDTSDAVQHVESRGRLRGRPCK